MGTRSKRLSALLVGSCVYCLVLVACGGGGAAGSEAPAKAPPAAANAPADESSDSEEATAEPAEEPKAALCDDGTCSPCGAGMCPSGWYCDESASGGPACGWLPRCTQKPSCACLTSKLGAGCKCSEQGGGLHVTCR
ncbi:MAG TPA: hypothetical protein VER11_28285 [Polyangiaceae bacterium]|nr:hypothetical protein [Polyangiaceae bacterium]